jgi:hypothetical protein
MKKTGIVLFFLLLLLTAFGQPHQLSAQSKEKKVPLLEKKTVEYWINYLASDSMRGRRNGSPEMKTAAQWIANKFKECGLKTFPHNDGYLQHYFFKRGKDSVAENNVVGYIEGSDPKLKNEYIVITGHFDHVGVGKPVKGDSIYNGADDNASGTCAVIGIAKTLSMMKVKPARTIVFAAVSGEEAGMRGSRFFTNNPGFPIENVYLNINFEMLGQCKSIGKNKYFITGPNYTNLKEILHAYNKDKNWKMIDTVKSLAYLFYASDNASFAAYKKKDNINYGVPAHTFVTFNDEGHLHQPNDEAKYFDFDNYRNFIQYISEFTLYLTVSKTPIVWTDSRFKRLVKE